LKGSLNNAEGNGTHICLIELKSESVPGQAPRFCNAILKLHKSKPTPTGSQSWLTTRGTEHLAKDHPIDSVVGAKLAKEAKDRHEMLMEKQLSFGMPDAKGHVVGNDNSMFMMTKKEKALSSQAQWYTYSTMHISKSEFESPYFKRMLAGGEDLERNFVLTEANLKNYVRAEFGVFLHLLVFMLNLKHDDAMGNRFAQALHDGGTLVSKRKYQALALQFIPPEWKKNLVVTLALKKSSKNADADAANLWKEVVDERCGGLEYEDIVGRMRSDRAAKGVAGVLDMEEEEVCEMHDTEKLGRSATGGLVRTRNKVAVNPFQEGVDLVQRAHKLGAYFGYSTRRENLEIVGKTLGNVPDIKIQVDYNTTRIAAVHGLLHSELRLNRALRAYEVQFNPGWAFKADDWQAVAEFEGVLNCTRVTSTLAQRERGFNGAFTPLIKTLALTKLRSDQLYLIDMPNVKLSPAVPRVAVMVDNLSRMGQTARVRAILEGERRWCGNNTEELTGAAVTMGKSELLCTLLDKRTLGCHHITAEQRGEAYQIYLEEYVEFSLQASKYSQKEVQRAIDKRAELAAAAAAAVNGIVAQVVVKEEADKSMFTSGNLFQGTTWSDDEEEETEGVHEVPKEVVALEEAKRAFKNWKKLDVDWLEMFPELMEKKKMNSELDLVEDLMDLDMGVLYNHLEKVDTGRQLYGLIPKMACNSTGQLGALSAESYCERVLSCANNVVTTGNTLLSDEEVEMLVILRMNREFMEFMREHYGAVAKQKFGQTVVRD
jgi:hypothetical protein